MRGEANYSTLNERYVVHDKKWSLTHSIISSLFQLPMIPPLPILISLVSPGFRDGADCFWVNIFDLATGLDGSSCGATSNQLYNIWATARVLLDPAVV